MRSQKQEKEVDIPEVHASLMSGTDRILDILLVQFQCLAATSTYDSKHNPTQKANPTS